MQGESFPAVSQSSALLCCSPLAVWKALSALTTGEDKAKTHAAATIARLKTEILAVIRISPRRWGGARLMWFRRRCYRLTVKGDAAAPLRVAEAAALNLHLRDVAQCCPPRDAVDVRRALAGRRKSRNTPGHFLVDGGGAACGWASSACLISGGNLSAFASRRLTFHNCSSVSNPVKPGMPVSRMPCFAFQ